MTVMFQIVGGLFRKRLKGCGGLSWLGRAAMCVLFFPLQTPLVASDYIARVIAYADTMLAYGTDDARYGPNTSPLFASALTRGKTPELVVESEKYPDWPPRFTDLPNVFVGGDAAHKITIRGCDIGTETSLMKLLWRLSEVTGDSKYAEAADACLQWWTENAADGPSGLYPWGEHTGWDFRADQIVDGNAVWTPRTDRPGDTAFWAKHEFQNPKDNNAILDRMAMLPASGVAPLEAHARSLWTNHVWMEDVPGDGSSALRPRWSRHGQFGSIGNDTARKEGGGYPRIVGHMIETWAVIGQYTQDPPVREEMAKYIEVMVNELDLQMDEHGYIPFDLSKEGEGTSPDDYNLNNGQNDIVARALRNAAPRLWGYEAELAEAALELEARIEPGEVRSYASANDLMKEDIADRDLGKNATRGGYQPPWDLPGKIPLQFADAINRLLAAAEEDDASAPHTGADYLARANYFGDIAVDLFLNDGTGSALPRMLDKHSPSEIIDPKNPDAPSGIPAPAFYHSYTGGADLMAALLNLAIANGSVTPGRERLSTRILGPNLFLEAGGLRHGRRYALMAGDEVSELERAFTFQADSPKATFGEGRALGAAPRRFYQIEEVPVAARPPLSDLGTVATYAADNVEFNATVLTAAEINEALGAAFDTSLGGVINFETTLDDPSSFRAGLGALGANVVELVNQLSAFNFLDNPGSGRMPVSGTGSANGGTTSGPNWDVSLGAVEGEAAGSRVTAFGITVLNRANQDGQNVRVTVYFDDESTAEATAYLAGQNDQAVAGGGDTFYGFEAPEGRYITRFTVEMLGGEWTSLDDLVILTSEF